MLCFLLYAKCFLNYYYPPPSSISPYNAKARTKPASTESPPFAKFAIAALVAVLLDDGAVLTVEAGVEATTVVPAAVVRAVVEVEGSVTFELGDGFPDGVGVAKLEVLFALVEVETTVAVDEGIEEVLVDVLLAMYEGPVESLMVVVKPIVADEDELDPDPLMWNGWEYCDRVVFFSSSMKKP